MIKFVVIVNTYNPSIDKIKKIIETLVTSDNRIKLFIIITDSSPTALFLEGDLKTIVMQGSVEIKYLKLENFGEPYALNSGIKFAKINYNPDLIMLLTDDAILYSKIPYISIYEYFIKNCNPERDILIVTDVRKVPQRIIRRTTENGMVFSPLLFDKLKFEEDLVMDQFDFMFCDSIYLAGGKIIVFPDSLS